MISRIQNRALQVALAAIFLIILLPTSTFAEDYTTQNGSTQDTTQRITKSEAKPVLPLWEAGLFAFGYSQPAYPGSEDRANLALPLPYVIYRGQYLRIDRGTVGVRALKTPRYEFDVGFAGSLGSHSSGIEARKGMEDLGTMIEFGPRLKINLGDISSGRSNSRLQFPLREVIDVSHGFISRGIAFEPQWVTDRRLPDHWFISTSLGAVFGDEKLTDTLYGVTPAEATPLRASYDAKSGLIALRAGLLAAHSFSPDVRLFNYIQAESLAGAVNRDSPLVRRKSGWSVGIGLAWTLGRSDYNAAD